MNDNANGGGRHPPRSPKFFVGRHFSWMARTAVKIAKELELSDEQFLKLIELLVKELRETNINFNRDIFVSHIRVAAYAVKQNESALEALDKEA
jgi:hypothetical protein